MEFRGFLLKPFLGLLGGLVRRRIETLVNTTLQQGLSKSHTKLCVLFQKVNEQTQNSLLDGINKGAILALTEVALNVILSKKEL